MINIIMLINLKIDFLKLPFIYESACSVVDKFFWIHLRNIISIYNVIVMGISPLAAEEFFFIFFFENLIKNTYYWLDQGKKVKNAKKNFKGVFLGILRVAL